jgi:hypothetical protein
LTSSEIASAPNTSEVDPEIAAYVTVLGTLLGSDEGRRLVLVAGACIGLLLLVDEASVGEIASLGGPTHPHISERLITALVVESNLATSGAVPLTDALWLALLIVNGKSSSEELAWLRSHADLEAPEQLLQSRDADSLFSRYRLDELLERLAEVRLHIKELGKRMARDDAALTSAALVANPAPYRWY